MTANTLAALLTLLAALTAPTGDAIIHAWQDTNRDLTWQRPQEPGIDAEILLMYLYLGPPHGQSYRTGPTGIAVANYLTPGTYHIAAIAFNPAGQPTAPYYAYQTTTEIHAGDTTIVRIPFWTWATLNPPAASMNEPGLFFDYAKGEKPASFGPGDEPPGWTLTDEGWRRTDEVLRGITLPPGLPPEWAGRPETRGWYPNLAIIEGLYCGRKLRDCGAAIE